MPIPVHCPECKAKLKVPDKAAGRRVKCPKCSSVISVKARLHRTKANSNSTLPPKSSSSRPRRPSRKQHETTSTTGDQQKHSSPLKWILIAAGSVCILVAVAYGAFLAGQAGTDSNQQASFSADVGQFDSVESADAEERVVATTSSSTQSSADQPLRPATNDFHLAVPTPASPAATNAPAPQTTESPGSSTASAESAEPQIHSDVVKVPVSFETLLMDEPATSLAVTEDGRFAVFSHQTANLISVYDIAADRIVKTFSCTAPRALLCRGDLLFAGNFGEGKVSVYSISKGWTLKNELQVTKPNIVYMSAASRGHFAGEILVTCHNDGNRASYQGSYIYQLDAARDRCDLVSRSAMASVSYDGKNVLTQGSFNLSPSGGLSVFSFDEFVAGDAEPIFRGGIQQTPFVYQPYSGSYWLSENMIFGGAPIKLTHNELGQILVPDTLQKIVYVLDEDVISARRVNASLSETDEKPRRIQWPSQYKKDSSRLFHQLERRRSYHLDHPIAVTLGNVLTLLLLDQKNGSIVKSRTVPFGIPEGDVDPEPQVVEVKPHLDSNPSAVPERFPRPDVTSAPETIAGLLDKWPTLVVAGTQFTHQFPVDADDIGVELMDGPEGMKVSDNGMLTWNPTAASIGRHQLKIRVSRPSGPYFERPEVEVISEQLAGAVGGDLSKVNQFDSLDLDIDHYALIPGYDRKSHLLLQGKSLRILAADGLSVEQTIELPQRYHDIEERADAYVAISSKPPFIDILEKKNQRVRKHIDLTFTDFKVMEVTDLAIHPDRRTSFVCVKYDIELPRYTVLFVDEQTSTAVAPGVIGNWAEVSSDGNTLYTGYRDIYEKGSHFHLNPDWRLIEIPEYGSIDMLMKWEIHGRKPVLQDIVRQAGGNGNGIRLSSDENRIVYLSHVGTPLHSQNLLGFSTQDFDRPAINYEAKGRASTKEAAFHPFLPWIAMPGNSSVTVVNQNTGVNIVNRLMATVGGLGEDPIERLFFSGDGKALILLRNGGETGRYLQRIPLILERSEQSATPPSRRRLSAVVPERRTVTEKDLNVLSTAPGDVLTSPLEIGREFTNSVVIIRTPRSSGTGFIVGDDGFVLTCAHVVNALDEVTIAYKVSGNPGASLEGSAEVVEIDEEKDVALLYFKPRRPLKTVRLRNSQQLEAGEPVTVIGNPAAGDAVLNHTMTAGIISNPKRDIDGQNYIQLSAAVNPGNSGGPLFDQYGNVAGLIALKARIEGASFAVPAETLRRFLKSAARKR